MKYEDYKLEDCYFLNHGEEWDEDERAEVLSTFPETKNDEQKIATLEQLIEDIKNGVLKVNRYGEIHASSAKAYVKNHGEWLAYRCETYSHSAGMYMRYGNDEHVIKRSWNAEDLLKKIGNEEYRLKNIIMLYTKREQSAKNKREEEQYETIHADRIKQGKRVYEKMTNTDLKVVTDIEIDGIYQTYYHPVVKRLYGYNYLDHNRYGEIQTQKGKFISLEAGQELEKALDEMAKELTDIIDIYHGRFTDILRKGTED